LRQRGSMPCVRRFKARYDHARPTSPHVTSSSGRHSPTGQGPSVMVSAAHRVTRDTREARCTRFAIARWCNQRGCRRLELVASLRSPRQEQPSRRHPQAAPPHAQAPPHRLATAHHRKSGASRHTMRLSRTTRHASCRPVPPCFPSHAPVLRVRQRLRLPLLKATSRPSSICPLCTSRIALQSRMPLAPVSRHDRHRSRDRQGRRLSSSLAGGRHRAASRFARTRRLSHSTWVQRTVRGRATVKAHAPYQAWP
jgi:hypothetical protein